MKISNYASKNFRNNKFIKKNSKQHNFKLISYLWNLKETNNKINKILIKFSLIFLFYEYCMYISKIKIYNDQIGLF